MIKLKIDEQLRDLFPPLTKEEYDQLEENIIRDGCTSPLFAWKGYIVDGHNRYGICRKHNIEFQVIELDKEKYKTKDDIIQWMISTQCGRRNLTPLQKIAIAEKYRLILLQKAKENQRNGGNPIKNPINTRDTLARIASVSHDTYDKGKKILENDDERIKQKVLRGELKINTAYNLLFNNNKKSNRKPLSNIILKHLINKSNGKCEICNWGGIGLESILIPHHIHKYSETEDNSIDNLVLLCPNCHNTIHTLEKCSDNSMSYKIKNSINKNILNKIEYYVNEIKE